MKLGEVILVYAMFSRRTLYMSNIHGHIVRQKIWVMQSISPRTALFLGPRTLYNGTTEWEDEAGYVFSPNAHIRAALVCFSTRTNPVYVPWGEEDSA